MKPRVFIGSSIEGLDYAYAIQEELEHTATVTVWPQGIFAPSGNTVDSLVTLLGSIDFGVFVFSPDDTLEIRGKEASSVRDNVIFELGLFIGRLGKDRSFFVIPRGETDLHLPTDLLGVTPLTFDANRPDSNLRAALGPACNQLRRAIKTKGIFPPPQSSTVSEQTSDIVRPKNAQTSQRTRKSAKTTKNVWWEAVEKAVQEYKRRYHPSSFSTAEVKEFFVSGDKASMVVDICYIPFSGPHQHEYYELTITPTGDLLGFRLLEHWPS